MQETRFLQEATQQLIKNRRMLQYSYVRSLSLFFSFSFLSLPSFSLITCLFLLFSFSLCSSTLSLFFLFFCLSNTFFPSIFLSLSFAFFSPYFLVSFSSLYLFSFLFFSMQETRFTRSHSTIDKNRRILFIFSNSLRKMKRKKLRVFSFFLSFLFFFFFSNLFLRYLHFILRQKRSEKPK